MGKYPDGTPAIVEGRSGKGWVLLVGTHPEAPESWRHGMIFTTPTAAAHAYAGTLIDAALRARLTPGDRVMSSASYEVHEVNVAARPVAGVRAQVPRGRVAQEFGRHLDHVYAVARAGAVHLDGQNILIYREATADVLTVDFCVGVIAPFAAVGPVEPFQTPHGVAAMTTHVGDYGRLAEANAAILAWCRANDRLRAGPSWEVYGHWHADPALLRTEVYYLLRPAGAEAGRIDIRKDG